MKMRSPVLILLAILLLSPSLCGREAAIPGSMQPAVVGGDTHDGVEIMTDLPPDQHVRNFGAPADKKGLCVFATLDMDARWHNCRELVGVIHKVQQGGGWPEKVEEVVKENAPGVKLVQYEGTDPAILDRALASGAPAGVTYGYGERYNNQTIYHMVLLVHFDGKYAAILDNNFPATYEWMSREEFLRRWVHPGGRGWAYVLLAAPPPPPPHN